jgi:hypothetical protein
MGIFRRLSGSNQSSDRVVTASYLNGSPSRRPSKSWG